MARPNKITLTGSGSGTTNSSPLLLNWRARPFEVALAFDTGGSTTGFTVQMALNDPLVTAAASWTWFNHTELAAMTADETGNLAFPVTAIRLQADANGTDTGTLFVIQSGG